ncbi:MAG: DUF3526 domain-containing protein [Rhodothermales bacterium]
MILRIAKKETVEMMRDGRYRWAASILFVLLLGAVMAGWKHYNTIEVQRAVSESADRDLWLDQGEKSQHSAAHFGVYAFKPSSPLSAVDQGVLPYTGVSVFMEAHSVKDATFRPIEDATAVQRLGTLTASTTLQLLMPLLIILLAYGTFSSEREKGTMRQLLSLGIPRYMLGLGKAVGVAGPLFLVLIPFTLLGTAAIVLFEGPEATMWGGGRYVFFVLLYLLYFSIYVLVSLLVSARATSSRQALLVLVGIWFFGSFVVPRFVTDIAQSIYPTPSASAFEQAIETDMDAQPTWTNRTTAVQTRLMEEYDVETVEAIPTSVAGHTLLEAERDETLVYRKHFDALQDLYAQQEIVTQGGALLSPMLAVQLTSMGLAGSDYMHHRDFVKAAESYRFEYVQTLNQDMIDTGASWDYKIGRALWEKIPAFTYESPSVSAIIDHYKISLVVIISWNLALLMLTWFSIKSMKIG